MTADARKAPRVTWLAGPDGQAHATIGQRRRTTCGCRPVEPRYAWSEIRPRCAACLAAVKEVTPPKRRQ